MILLCNIWGVLSIDSWLLSLKLFWKCSLMVLSTFSKFGNCFPLRSSIGTFIYFPISTFVVNFLSPCSLFYVFFLLSSRVVYIRAIWRTLHLKPQKTKKKIPEKNFLYFQKWNFLAQILKNFLYIVKRKLFLYFWKRNPVTFSPSPKNKRTPLQENLLYFRKPKPPQKNFMCFLKRKLFLYFRKGKLLKSLYLGGNLQCLKNKRKSLCWRNFLFLMTFL